MKKNQNGIKWFSENEFNADLTGAVSRYACASIARQNIFKSTVYHHYKLFSNSIIFKFKTYEPVVISLYKAPIMQSKILFSREVLEKRTKSFILLYCIVTHLSTCACRTCSGIVIWTSGRLTKVKKNIKNLNHQTLKVVVVRYDDLTGKILVLWKCGREVGLYYSFEKNQQEFHLLTFVYVSPNYPHILVSVRSALLVPKSNHVP